MCSSCRVLSPVLLLSWLLRMHGEGPLYRHMGCFRDADMGEGRRVIPPLEHQDAVLDGNYKGRKDAIKKCAIAAWNQGLAGFVIQDGGWCGASAGILDKYDIWGSASSLQPPYNCKDGMGGMWANDVYEIIGYDKPQSETTESRAPSGAGAAAAAATVTSDSSRNPDSESEL